MKINMAPLSFVFICSVFISSATADQVQMPRGAATAAYMGLNPGLRLLLRAVQWPAVMELTAQESVEEVVAC
jgi:hypothetical protein